MDHEKIDQFMFDLIIGRLNTPELRLKITKVLESIADIVAQESFSVQCDDNNNTSETQARHELYYVRTIDNEVRNVKIGSGFQLEITKK
jgi:hypothetical protein